MKPRITISEDANGQIEVRLNPAGRDDLVRELQHFSEQNDHFHLTPKEMDGEVALYSRGYRKGDRVFDWGKVMLRFDEWDERFFPHVLEENAPPHTDAHYYGMFMSGLYGLADDAELLGYSAEATALLLQAKELFMREFRARHPDAWKPKDPTALL